MIRERDSTRVTFKVNTAGSWANLGTCDSDRIDEVKAACEILAGACRSRFKCVDADGREIEAYVHEAGHYSWRQPRRRLYEGAKA